MLPVRAKINTGLKSTTYDFLVIGSGIAGLTFALKAAHRGRVCVVTKSELSDTNTSWAQGGVAAAVGENDSIALHEEDTLIAGAGLCNREAVRFLVEQAEAQLDWLISIGANFDLEPGSKVAILDLGREGGHSRNRIVHYADRSGWEIERALTVAVRHAKNIDVIEYAFCEGLLMSGSQCTGAILRTHNGPQTQIHAGSTLLATGSCCQVYRFTTNPQVATGDGIGLAASVGAKIENMEFIQFHPTTLYHRDSRNFLITEAVRGEGAILRTIRGRRFMYDYDPRGELAPRDIVARAIHAEIQKEGVPFVHLDMTHLSETEVMQKFPNIRETLLGFGIDVTREPIPVVPAAHYQCGGVSTDLHGRTSVSGLFAAGEVANTGVHGANRLASNSLLEALVFGASASESASPNVIEKGEMAPGTIPLVERNQADGIVRRLRRTMWEEVGIVRSNRGLRNAVETIEELCSEITPSDQFHAFSAEAANLLECGKQIASAAKKRTTNVGLHYNVDLGPPSEFQSN